MANNPVVRWQMISPNTQPLIDFYGRLFGWKAQTDNALHYSQVDTGSERGIHGGLWPAPADAPSFVQLFVEVEDCAAYLVQAVELGATVLMGPQTLPDGDTIALLKDPCGMSFGIMTPQQGGLGRVCKTPCSPRLRENRPDRGRQKSSAAFSSPRGSG